MARRTSITISLFCMLFVLFGTTLSMGDALKDGKADKAVDNAAATADADCPVLKKKARAKASSNSECPAIKGEEQADKNCADDADDEDAAKEKDDDAEKEADEKEEEKKEESKSKAKTVKATVEPMRIDVSLTGAVYSQQSHEMLFEPEAWSSWTIETIIPHGTKVKEGDELVTFESEKLKKRIAEMRNEMKLAEIRITLARMEHETLLKLHEKIVAWNKRADKIAREEHQTYLKITRPMNIESAQRRLESAKFTLEYEQEELRQLEKMYEADDLVEESEEIVLTRARRSLDRAEFYLKGAEIEHELYFKYHQPRRDETEEHQWTTGLIERSKERRTLPLSLKKAKLEMEATEKAHAKIEKQLEDLLADQELLTITAPTDGIVYYGKISHGKLSTTAHAAIAPRRPVTSGTTLFTIVETDGPLMIESNVEEKKLYSVARGMRASVIPTGFPSRRLKARVNSLDLIPKPCGYVCQLTVEADDHPIPLVPGMTAKIVVFSYENKAALTIPVKSLETDDRTGNTYVYLPAKEEGKPRKVRVETGRKTSSKIEILKGIKEGAEILEEPPEEDE